MKLKSLLRRRSGQVLVVVALALVVGVACSTSAQQVVEPPPDTGEASSALAQWRPGQIPLIKGPVSPDGLQAIFGTPVLGVGENRVGFVLTSPDALISTPEATVSSFFFPRERSEEGVLKGTTQAVFRPWPYGTRGLYTTSLTFDAPGRWGIEVSVSETVGSLRQAKLFFEVKGSASAPEVGAPAVKSKSKTLKDVERLSQLTTGSLHDPDLYQMTIAEAVTSGLPTVVSMLSPAFCINAVCGPQVEVLQELKNKYKGKANFIHVDFYDNPEEIQGDLSAARLSPTVMEWRLSSIEWSFVIDRKGIVSARFEAFATLEELEQALMRVL